MICVDASVAVKWVLEEPLSHLARSLYNDAIAADVSIVAPHLLPFEVTNVIFGRVRRAGYPWQEADSLFADFLAIAVEFHAPPNLHRSALRIAHTHGLSASYDAHYIALAEWLQCDLWTDDQRLLRALGGAFPFVRWIGDYSTPNPTT